MSKTDVYDEIAGAPFTFELMAYRRPDPKDIPRRLFYLGTAYQQGAVSITAAIGGAGKSTLTLSEALHMVAGLPFNGRKPPRPLNVYLWNGEEDEHEMNRRIAAAIDIYRAKEPDKAKAMEEAIDASRLFIHSKGAQPITLVEYDKHRTAFAKEEVVQAVIHKFTEAKIDVVIIDPLIKTHKINEDDNPGMAFLVETWDRIASACRCSVMLVPHTRKGKGDAREMTVDDIRGAGAFVYAARFARVLNAMTGAQAEKWSLSREEAWRYFRVDDVKRNYTQAARAEWYKLASFDIGNGEFGGDSVGVSIGFTPPATKDIKISPTGVHCIQKALRAEPERWRWSNSATGDLFISLVAKEMGIDTAEATWKADAKKVIKELLDAGFVKKVEGKGKNKNTVPYAQCGDKASRPVELEAAE